jgi:hypothetical protein
VAETLVRLVKTGINFASTLDAGEVKSAVGFLTENLKGLHDALAVWQRFHHERQLWLLLCCCCYSCW